ncbi:MAG: hypothetical protein MZU97_02750 [Bacillus subtilis]|nr:hypothetical protein [Bacillus subtilis]
MEKIKAQSVIDSTSKPNYRITTQEIIVDNKPDTNVIRLKNASIWLGKIKIASVPSLEFSTNKDITRIETKLPEIGQTRELGLYFGPSHVFYLPNSANFKSCSNCGFWYWR